MPSHAETFLASFAEAVATSARPQTTPPTPRQARKLRPVQLQADVVTGPPQSAFASARPAESNVRFVRQLPGHGDRTIQHQVNGSESLKARLEKRGQVERHTPHNTKRKPRRFVPLEQYQNAFANSHMNASVKESRLDAIPVEEDGEPRELLAEPELLGEPELRRRIEQHMIHIRTVSPYPRHFFPAVEALLSCFHASTTGESVSLWPKCHPSQVAQYCREVLHQTIPLFSDYPAPVLKAFQEALSDTDPHPLDLPFPTSKKVWAPTLAGSSTSLRALEAESENVSQRLKVNLETSWDQLLKLQRIYRGDISSCPPGTLDVNVALRTMAMLHPANMDFFAARLLRLVSDMGLRSHDTTVRMRQLGERMRDAPPRKRGEKGPGVVLHRLPKLVRSMFEDDPAQLFFLDFLTGVDSAKLNTALTPRLVAAVAKALETAAAATTNAAFTDSVLDARLYGKLLSVTMHASNWAHSAFSLSGMNDELVSPGLGARALRHRVPLHSAFYTAAIDLETLIVDAVASEQVLPVLACVAIADVIVRLAVVDPVAKASEWYHRCIHALRSVRAVSSSNEDETMPLLHAIVCELLESEACREEGPLANPDTSFVLRCDKTEWSAIGDTRLLRVVCPPLDQLRKSAHMKKGTTKAAVRRITPQAAPIPASAPPNAREDKEMKNGNMGEAAEGSDVQAALRREFYAKVDGRLRELIRVVVSSKPSRQSAKDTYLKVVDLLYPDAIKTVVAVAANLCEYEVGAVEREQKKDERMTDSNRDSDNHEVTEENDQIEKAEKGIITMKV